MCRRTRGWVIDGLVCSKRNGRVHSLRKGGYSALHKLLWWHWGGRTYCLIFLLYMSVAFEFDVFLSRDAMLARYMPSSCVPLCGVDVAYRRLIDWACLQWAVHSYHTQRTSPFAAMRVDIIMSVIFWLLLAVIILVAIIGVSSLVCVIIVCVGVTWLCR